MTEISNYYEFSYIFDCKNGNPNGDPDAANAPRQDYTTGTGWVSDVAIKRRIRNYVEMVKDGKEPNRIYITEGAVLDDRHGEAYGAAGLEAKKGTKVNGKAAELTSWMASQYYDVRLMGALMVGALNCGKVRGPLQFGPATSLDPIEPVEMSITRMASTKAEEGKDNKTMGNKWIVPYAAYRLNGYINAPLATKSGATEQDLALLWEALSEMWVYDKSAARPEMTARKLVVIKHPVRLRARGTPQLDEIVTITRQGDLSAPVRSWDQYAEGIEVHRDRLPDGVEVIETP